MVSRKPLVDQLVAQLRQWQHLPDPAHVYATLAVAATRHDDHEPTWLLIVAPPSSGKTEAVQLLAGHVDDRLDEVTAAGLLGWSKNRPARPMGILTRIGSHGLLTFSDLSNLLATSDRGGRDQVFALLRSVYDGRVQRDISPPASAAVTTLEWQGRVTVVACVTQAIDQFTAHADALGPRWVYVRIPDRSLAAKRRAAALARRRDLRSVRAEARDLAGRVLDSAKPGPAVLPDRLAATIEDAALVTTWGRAAVPRSGYGHREIEDLPVIEEPMRVVQQLAGLARGSLAIGLSEVDAERLARRVALDSMPAARRSVLDVLAVIESPNTATVAREAALDRKVTRRVLEDLAAVGVVERDGPDDDRTAPVLWRLKGEEGRLIRDVIASHRVNGGCS